MLTIDSDINIGAHYITTTNTTFTNANQLVTKGFVLAQIATVSGGDSIAPLTISTLNVAGTDKGSITNVVTKSTAMYEYDSQTGGSTLINDEAANVRYVTQNINELYNKVCIDNFSEPTNKTQPPMYHFVKAWYNRSTTEDVCIQSVNNKRVQQWYDRTGISGSAGVVDSSRMPTQQPISVGAADYMLSFSNSNSSYLLNSNLVFTRLGAYKNAIPNCTIFCAIKLNDITRIQAIFSADGGFTGPRLAIDNRDGSAISGSTYSFGVFTGTNNGSSKLARTNNGTGSIMVLETGRWYCVCLSIHAYKVSGNLYPSTSGGDVSFPQQTSLWVDNQLVVNEARCDGTEANTGGLFIGSTGSNVNFENFNGFIKELIVYNRSLDSIERTKVYNYFKAQGYASFNWVG